jgi:hypothetical protein
VLPASPTRRAPDTLKPVKYLSLASLALPFAGACSLFFDFESAPSVRPPDAAADSAKPSADASGDLDTGTPDVGDAGEPPPVGLSLDTTDPTKLVIEHPGRFRVVFTQSNRWQLDEWSDLRNAPGRVFTAGGGRPTLSPWEVGYAGRTCSVATANSDARVSVDVVTKTAIKLVTYATCSAVAERPLSMTGTYFVWASGRVQLLAGIASPDGAQMQDNTPMRFVQLAVPPLLDATRWDVVEAGNTGVLLRLANARTTMGFLQTRPDLGETLNTDSSRRYSYNALAGVTRIPTSPIYGRAELLLMPDLDSNAFAGRVQERANPSWETPVNLTGYVDADDGALYIERTGPGALSFSVPGDVPRHEFAFQVHKWTDATYTVRKNGTVVASNANPVAANVVTSYDTARNVIFVQDISITPRQAATTTYSVTP